MKENDLKIYEQLRSERSGFIELPRGLFAVWGKESVQFLDGLITNDVKTLEDRAEMLAAFPNAQGRLLALVRVLRQGERFLIETEEATRERLFQNLFRFTFAGDFFVEDLSEQYQYFEIWSAQSEPPASAGGFSFSTGRSFAQFIPTAAAADFRDDLLKSGSLEISEELYETLRIESGIPKYGVDMDETTIVPELGLEGMISYSKGCYIGQEIIARIHFRGHVAKQLTGLLSEPDAVATGLLPGAELTTVDGKNAGRITSVTGSPKLEKLAALAYVRYEHLAAGTQLSAGDEMVTVSQLPF
ncbi:MAG: folate-binding protein YgfZ [Pyrinomonadaceae bacterium]